MNLINIIILIAIVFIAIELLKHLVIRKFSKIVLIIAITVIALLVFSKYAVENNLVNPDNKFFITGSIITSNLEDLKDDMDLEEASKIKDDISKKTLTKIKSITN